MKCKNCGEEANKLYEYGGSNFCFRCLSEHINDDDELRQLAIEEWIENNCREIKGKVIKSRNKKCLKK